MKSRIVRIGFCLFIAAATLGVTCTGGVPNPGGGGPASMSAAEQQLATNALAAINAHRAGHGLAPLTPHAAGAQVAFQHSSAMQSGNFFAHVNPTTNTSPGSRAFNAGITHDPGNSIDPDSGRPFVGENLFMATNNNITAQIAVDSWVGSPGHHTQIDAPLPVAGAQTMPAWTHCGIGVRQIGNQSWWTAMFFRNPN